MTLCAYSTVMDWGEPRLNNSFWRCYLAVTDGAELILSGNQISLRTDTAVLIPPHCDIRGHADKPFRLFYAHFNCSLKLISAQPSEWRVDQDQLSELHQAVSEQNESKFRLLMMKLTASAIAAIPKEIITSWEQNDKMDSAFRILKENLGSRLTNQELAKRLNISESSLIRLFRDHAGTTPAKQHMLIRLDHAAKLLNETDASIEHIADVCGFWDRNHFTRAFTRQWDMAPAQYRRTVSTL